MSPLTVLPLCPPGRVPAGQNKRVGREAVNRPVRTEPSHRLACFMPPDGVTCGSAHAVWAHRRACGAETRGKSESGEAQPERTFTMKISWR